MPTSPINSQSSAVKIFRDTSETYQILIREILREEREVQHLKRRPDIHTKIYEHVRRIIK